jgi:hypothetical protein
MLVISLLLGIGAFAARSAHLATAASGMLRQQTQARYIGEYGILLVTSLLSGQGGASYIKAMGGPNTPPADTCKGQTGLIGRTCYKSSYAELQALVTPAVMNLCEPGPPAVSYPGSLGMARAQCNFSLELTDKVQGQTPPGFDPKTLKFYYVTATVTSVVQLQVIPGEVNDSGAAQSSGVQTLRSRILAGPFSL